MPAKLLEVEATYIGEKMRFGDGPDFMLIGEALIVNNGDGKPHRVTIKGTVDEDDQPKPHQSYRLYGRWSRYTHPRSGKEEKQFHFQTFVRSQPHTRAGVVGYLEKAPNIGVVLAGRLYDKFNSDSVRILREQPEVAVAAISKLTDEKAAEAAAWLVEQQGLEACTIELIELLDGRGFRKSLAKTVIKEWGNRAALIIKKNPYRLMQFPGCGFKRTDALYLALGLPPAALKRQALCGWHSLARNTSGDTWYFVGVVEQGIKGSIAGADLRIGEAVRLGTRGGLLAEAWTDGREGPLSWDGTIQWLAEERKARNEIRVAQYAAEAMADEKIQLFPVWPYESALSEHQELKLADALGQGCIGILGGSPGTGKTFTAAQLIQLVIQNIGHEHIAVCAPTGKAAVRIKETMIAQGIAIPAKTIHSLLKVESESGGNWSFCYNAVNPLPFSFIVVDEASMIDTDLMASLLSARARHAFILFVGDVNQLPPVGHGAPLRDMIAAGVPYGELREIRRNAGMIVQACAQIRDGEQFITGRYLDGDNLAVAPARTHQQQIEWILRLLDAMRTDDLDPIWDCQVLVAVNKKSAVSRQELNKLLQVHLNGLGAADQAPPFRLHDKVVNTKNRFYPPADKTEPPGEEVTTSEKGDIYVANGEIGRVVAIAPKYIEVKLVNPARVVRVPRGSFSDEGEGEETMGTGCDWDLAYALTCHKMQGSEIPVAIVVIDEYPGARSICDRAWLYTAISRAKKVCFLVGSKATADRFCRANNISRRKTFLTELIGHEIQRLKAETKALPVVQATSG